MHRVPRAALVALLALAFLAGTAGTASAAWDGNQGIILGDQITAEFAESNTGVVHAYRFFAPADTKLTATVKTLGGGNLVPGVALYVVNGAMVDVGGAGSAAGIKNYVIDESGWYELQITAENDSFGEYSLKTKGKFPKKLKLTTDDGAFEFAAVGGSVLSAKVKASKGSAAKPTITDVTPDVATDVNATKVKKLDLPESGDYAVEYENTGGEGDVDGQLSVKAPKSKRKYGFGVAEKPKAAPNEDEWMSGGHADATAEAFRHWDEDGAVSASCARCHSTPGFQDFIGADGSAAGSVEMDAPLGTTIECDACHNDTAWALTSVTFPSGAMATGLGHEAICMQCHQGRESTVSLNEHIASAEIADDDTVDDDLSFRNVHYFAAGATLFGGGAMGAYQYAGMLYDERNPHVAAYDDCTDCHNVHTLERKIDECANCHTGVASDEDLHSIRMKGSVRDYNGNGDATEGIYDEIKGLEVALIGAMQLYANADANVMPIAYSPTSYPYFFVDDNNNGMRDEGETTRYATWTARLLRAAYNYQYAQKDPGAYAHNPKYVIEFLYDSIASLNEVVAVPNFASMFRNDSGHFDGGAEAFRHWDSEQEGGVIDRGTVSTSCVRCHSPDGFDFWAEWGIDATKPQQVGDGMRCETCHTGAGFTDGNAPLKYIAEVDFPSGVTIENDDQDPDSSFLCMSCHKGREAKATVDANIASGKISFRNIHYLAAGATLYGADAEVGYEYDGKAYDGKWGADHPIGAKCENCHLADHSFKPQVTSSCMPCHNPANGIDGIRLNRATDYNGNGNTTEPLRMEVMTFGERVYDAIRAHAKDVVGTGIVYDSSHYPYWFQDADNDGVADVDGGGDPIGYPSWDAALAKAAFNYQFWQKEPGAWAHNTNYILQLLYDSIDDLGGDLTNLTRP